MYFYGEENGPARIEDLLVLWTGRLRVADNKGIFDNGLISRSERSEKVVITMSINDIRERYKTSSASSLMR